MTISNIVVVITRIYGLQWCISGAVGLIEIFSVIHGSKSFSGLLPSMLIGLWGVVAWLLAPVLARFITRGYDGPVSINGLTLADLYTFAFIFLGLYFMLGNLANLLTYLYYALRVIISRDYDSVINSSLYSLSQPLITFAAGAACLFNGRRWAGRLSARDM
ncbi:MAG TPA: hypothetical protein VH413_06330 [Verrucomicrobiae bacterium]|jgi:hypothetical protein|nr:hypothetical protein [Verrucomicrobiae bacterium]